MDFNRWKQFPVIQENRKVFKYFCLAFGENINLQELHDVII